MSQKKFTRKVRNFLIYPRFQLTLVGINVSVILVTLLLFWIVANNLVQNLKPSAQLSGIDVEFFRNYLIYQTAQATRYFFYSALAAVVLTTSVTLIVSHRLAGPMVRMRNYFTAIVKEETSPVSELSFRDGDFFQDLPTVINIALAKIATRTSVTHPPSKMG